MKKHTISFAVAGALCALLSQSALAAPDWSKVPKKDIHVFHPGVAPIEWVSGKGEHSGASGLKKGEGGMKVWSETRIAPSGEANNIS